MTLEDIQARVAEINNAWRDCERAHSKEDDLRADFIAYVAKAGDAHLQALAAEVLKTDLVDFPRYCA